MVKKIIVLCAIVWICFVYGAQAASLLEKIKNEVAETRKQTDELQKTMIAHRAFEEITKLDTAVKQNQSRAEGIISAFEEIVQQKEPIERIIITIENQLKKLESRSRELQRESYHGLGTDIEPIHEKLEFLKSKIDSLKSIQGGGSEALQEQVEKARAFSKKQRDLVARHTNNFNKQFKEAAQALRRENPDIPMHRQDKFREEWERRMAGKRIDIAGVKEPPAPHPLGAFPGNTGANPPVYTSMPPPLPSSPRGKSGFMLNPWSLFSSQSLRGKVGVGVMGGIAILGIPITEIKEMAMPFRELGLKTGTRTATTYAVKLAGRTGLYGVIAGEVVVAGKEGFEIIQGLTPIIKEQFIEHYDFVLRSQAQKIREKLLSDRMFFPDERIILAQELIQLEQVRKNMMTKQTKTIQETIPSAYANDEYLRDETIQGRFKYNFINPAKNLFK